MCKCNVFETKNFINSKHDRKQFAQNRTGTFDQYFFELFSVRNFVNVIGMERPSPSVLNETHIFSKKVWAGLFWCHNKFCGLEVILNQNINFEKEIFFWYNFFVDCLITGGENVFQFLILELFLQKNLCWILFYSQKNMRLIFLLFQCVDQVQTVLPSLRV